MNAKLISVMKRFAFGWLGLAWSSLAKFVENGKAFNLTGAGIWTKSSSELTANWITYGEPSTTRYRQVNCLNLIESVDEYIQTTSIPARLNQLRSLRCTLHSTLVIVIFKVC